MIFFLNFQKKLRKSNSLCAKKRTSCSSCKSCLIDVHPETVQQHQASIDAKISNLRQAHPPRPETGTGSGGATLLWWANALVAQKKWKPKITVLASQVRDRFFVTNSVESTRNAVCATSTRRFAPAGGIRAGEAELRSSVSNEEMNIFTKSRLPGTRCEAAGLRTTKRVQRKIAISGWKLTTMLLPEHLKPDVLG